MNDLPRDASTRNAVLLTVRRCYQIVVSLK